MKKAVLVIALCMLLAVAAGAADPMDDKEFRTGLKHYNSRNYKAAVIHFREYAGKHPDPAVYYLIGYSLYELGRFSEADEYFREAFFIDPEFSLEKAGLLKKKNIRPLPKAPAAGKHIGAANESIPPQPSIQRPDTATNEAAPVKSAPAAQMSKTPELPSSQPVTKPEAPEQGRQMAPPEPPAPMVQTVPPMPEFKRQMPAQGVGSFIAMIAALGMFMFIIWLAFYIYFCLCLFLIAKKLNVEAPWIAWVPLVQVWTIVASAGKPWWWILLLFVPIVNIFAGVYIWMCITENLSRNKWLGLLMMVPVINMIFLGILAFSKSEQEPGETSHEETLEE